MSDACSRPSRSAGLEALDSFGGDVFQKLGSWEMLASVVSSMYNKLFSDERTRFFFENADRTKVMSHMTGFLSCALGGKMALSPKQLWHIHRDMMWHPNRTSFDARHTCSVPVVTSGSTGAARSSDGCSVAAVSDQADRLNELRSSAPSTLSGGCPFAQSSCPKAACSKQAAEGDLPPLGPGHVMVMVELLTEALRELNAREELIKETTKMLQEAAWVFERGDMYHDPKHKEETWQKSNRLKVSRSLGSIFEASHSDLCVDPWHLVAATVRGS